MASRLPLLCRAGRHRPLRETVWNRGFYFSMCTRCGVDLVRAAGERWHRPRGAKVVWRTAPPANYRQGELTSTAGANGLSEPAAVQSASPSATLPASLPARDRRIELDPPSPERRHPPLALYPATTERPVNCAMPAPPPPLPKQPPARGSSAQRSAIPDFMGSDPPPSSHSTPPFRRS